MTTEGIDRLALTTLPMCAHGQLAVVFTELDITRADL